MKFRVKTIWTDNMSYTIDQQRQRVEQEMTRMVDDLDRSVLRKMQVMWRNLHNIL